MSRSNLAPLSRSQTMAENKMGQPQGLHSSQSFSRLQPSGLHALGRSRASTLQHGFSSGKTSSEAVIISQNSAKSVRPGDIFEQNTSGLSLAKSQKEPAGSSILEDVPEGFDELPIELVSLTDRFIDSLTAKVHSAPPSIDKLSDIFQEFYIKASSHISTHINALSTRQSRETSPTPSLFSKPLNNSRDSTRLRSVSSKDTVGSAEKSVPEQQMLTPQEISDRRKARRLLEQKGVALEEAVEKRICERVYKRIWRHRSTLDEVRDEKLRSRTAALALVGIGLEDLGIKIGQPLVDSQNTEVLKDLQIDEWMSKARDGLFKMNDVKSPKEKLEHLAATHKSIVDMLTKFHQSSSSADEILPTLIYTLITTPPEGINVISNLNFTQRFRAANKIDGEAAYCLTNLEAAISFLETVDLASLRSDEALEGPPKSASRPSTPRDDCHPEWPINDVPSSTGVFADSITPATTSSPRSDPVMVSNPLESPGLAKLPHPANATNPRRSSNLFQPQINAIEAAGDAVRLTADQGLKNIGNSLDNSFRFLFGRLKEHHLKNDHAEAQKGPILPRTLDDARKLVDPESNFDEEADPPGATLAAEHPDPQAETHVKMEDRLLGLFGGQRDRSADSAQSSSSGKRAGFAPENTKINDKAGSPSQLPAVTSTPPSHSPQPESNNVPNAAVESMRNLGNTLNPLNRLAGMNVMRGFGRTSSNSSSAATSGLTRTEKPLPDPWETVSKDKVMAPPRQDSTQTTRPIQRFLDVVDASELKIGEIEELLKDYKRLASDLKKFVQKEHL